jgi:hypothetical protein
MVAYVLLVADVITELILMQLTELADPERLNLKKRYTACDATPEREIMENKATLEMVATVVIVFRVIIAFIISIIYVIKAPVDTQADGSENSKGEEEEKMLISNPGSKPV